MRELGIEETVLILQEFKALMPTNANMEMSSLAQEKLFFYNIVYLKSTCRCFCVPI